MHYMSITLFITYIYIYIYIYICHVCFTKIVTYSLHNVTYLNSYVMISNNTILFNTII